MWIHIISGSLITILTLSFIISMLRMWGALGENFHSSLGIIILGCVTVISSFGFAAWLLTNRLKWNS